MEPQRSPHRHMVSPIKELAKGSTDTLLNSDRGNELIKRLNALTNMKVVESDAGQCELSVDPASSTLTIPKRVSGGTDLDALETQDVTVYHFGQMKTLKCYGTLEDYGD